MRDLSGNGHDYYLPHDSIAKKIGPAFQVGFSDAGVGYSTPFAVIGLDSWPESVGGRHQIYEQTLLQKGNLNATGEFYIAAAAVDTRTRGIRNFLGTTLDANVLLDQKDNRPYIIIGGSPREPLTDKQAYADGPVLLEIWRDSSGKVTTYVNGQDKSRTGAAYVNNSTFALTGFGWDATNEFIADNSLRDGTVWDDTALELIVCKGSTNQTRREATRSYMKNKWSLY